MFARLVGCLTVVAGLLMFVAALWIPMDHGRAGEAEPPSEATELAILPGDCAMFVTVRPRDFARDVLARGFSEATQMWSGIERSLDLKLADVERMTFATIAGEIGGVEIIRSRKVFDPKKLLSQRVRNRFEGVKDKSDGAELMAASEKKIGDRTVYYFGRESRWTNGICAVDRNTFITGNMSSLESLLGSKEKPSPELKAMLAEAGKHSVVVGFEGRCLRSLFNKEFRGIPKGGFEVPDSGKEKEGVVLLPFEVMPYKPLLMAKTGMVTLDIGDGYRAHGKAVFPSKESADEAEHSLKTLLYVMREYAVTIPEMDRGMKALAPVMDAVQKAFKTARVARKDNTLEASVRLTVDPNVAKKAGEELAAERKRMEERYKKPVYKGTKREVKEFEKKE